VTDSMPTRVLMIDITRALVGEGGGGVSNL
jgi:hypothetical protein